MYALGTGNYLNDKLESVVLVASCMYPAEGSTYDLAVQEHMWFRDQSIYSLGGEDWEESLDKICDSLGEPSCSDWKYFGTATDGPIKTMQYYAQNEIEGRFMELIPIEQYAAGVRSAPSIEYEDLDDSFLINMIIGERDNCNMDQAERTARDMSGAHTSIHMEYGFNHLDLAYVTDTEYVDRLVGYIEEGAEYARHRHGHHDDEDGMSTMVWDMIFGADGASTLVTGSALALSALILASY